MSCIRAAPPTLGTAICTKSSDCIQIPVARGLSSLASRLLLRVAELLLSHCAAAIWLDLACECARPEAQAPHYCQQTVTLFVSPFRLCAGSFSACGWDHCRTTISRPAQTLLFGRCFVARKLQDRDRSPGCSVCQPQAG